MKIKNINRPFLLVLSLAVALRLAIVLTKYHCLNSDNGILGLMARHILKGEFPIFFYGQPYMGSLEAFIIAFFFLIFGISVNSMILAMTLISTLGVVSAYFLGKELQDKKLGIYAMLIAAIPPAYIFWHSLSAFGGYPETLLFGNIILTFTLKTVKEENYREKTNYYLWLGFISGLAFWTHLLIVYYLVPVALFLLINEKKKFLFLRAPLFIIPALILGSLPLWVYNIQHGFASFKLPVSKNTFEAFIYFFHMAQLLLLSGQSSWFALITLSVYVISLIFLFAHNEKTKLSISPKFIFFLLFASIIYFFSGSHMALQSAPRHIIPLFTVGFISVAYLSWHLGKKYRYWGIIPLLVVLSFNGIDIYKSYLADKEESYTDHKLFTQLINFLSDNKLNTNYCPFVISQKLNFLSGEKTINADPVAEKYPPYENILEEADNIAFIDLNTHLEPMFNMLCQSYSRQNISGINIYYNLNPKRCYGTLLPSKNWKAVSNYNNEDTGFAFDRNADTYWCTIAKQKKGMYFELDLGNIHKIYKIALLNANHWRNYASSISIEVSKDGKQWTALDIPNSPEPIFLSGPRFYWHLNDGRFEFVFNPVECRYIKIKQDGKNILDPWEINELFVWEYLGERTNENSEASEIYNYLSSNKITCIYADFWLSAKIRKLSKDKIKTLLPINRQYPQQDRTSRFLEIDKGIAFIIDNENLTSFENNLSALGINLEKKSFKDYTCFYCVKKPQINEFLYWSGHGLLKTNRIIGTQGSGTPIAIFKDGTRLVGYNAKILGGNLEMNYFWQAKKLPEKTFVFVYFIKGDKIIFQNDHPLLEQFPLTSSPGGNEIFRETYLLQDPPHGTYEVVLGLCTPDKQNRRIKITYPKHKGSKISLGKINI